MPSPLEQTFQGRAERNGHPGRGVDVQVGAREPLQEGALSRSRSLLARTPRQTHTGGVNVLRWLAALLLVLMGCGSAPIPVTHGSSDPGARVQCIDHPASVDALALNRDPPQPGNESPWATRYATELYWHSELTEWTALPGASAPHCWRSEAARRLQRARAPPVG